MNKTGINPKIRYKAASLSGAETPVANTIAIKIPIKIETILNVKKIVTLFFKKSFIFHSYIINRFPYPNTEE